MIKTDENDVKLLEEVYYSEQNAYTLYLPRQISKDIDVLAYEKLTKVIVQFKNLSVGGDLIKEINAVRRKLARRIRKKYKDIIDLFSDVKGLGGVSLIHFLMLVPEVTSFRSLNSFLRYLGIKSSRGNKRARTMLYRMALQIKRSNKELRKYSITKIQRYLARIIYQRLREKG